MTAMNPYDFSNATDLNAYVHTFADMSQNSSQRKIKDKG